MIRFISVFLIYLNLSYSQTEDKNFDIGFSYSLSNDSFLHDNPFMVHGNVKISEFDFLTLKAGLKVYYFPLKDNSLSPYFSSQFGFNPQIIGTKELIEEKLFFNLGLGYYFGSFDNIFSLRDDLNSPEVIINAKVKLHGLTLCPEFRFNFNPTFHFIANYTYINSSVFKNNNNPGIDYNLINLGLGFSF